MKWSFDIRSPTANREVEFVFVCMILFVCVVCVVFVVEGGTAESTSGGLNYHSES